MARIGPAELTLFDLRKSWFNLLLRLFVRWVALLAPPLLCSHNTTAHGNRDLTEMVRAGVLCGNFEALVDRKLSGLEN